MRDYSRRVKNIQRRLDLGGREDVIIIRPPKYGEETEAEYQERISRPLDETKYLPARSVTAGGVTIHLPRELRPEFYGEG